MELEASAQLDLLLRLAIAVALSATIGVERELQAEPAGLRTHSLVGLGAATFTVVSSHAFTGSAFAGSDPDPTRIAAQIVTGVGFIGAGTILRQEGSVRGLSTAASLWAVGAIGMACGAGLYVLAVGATVLALIVLEVLERLEMAVIRDRGRSTPPHAPSQTRSHEHRTREQGPTLRPAADHNPAHARGRRAAIVICPASICRVDIPPRGRVDSATDGPPPAMSSSTGGALRMRNLLMTRHSAAPLGVADRGRSAPSSS